MKSLERSIGPLSALSDDLRRRLYLYTRGQTHAVSREKAASAVGVPRKLAAFHLDKLVEQGLLTYDYQREPAPFEVRRFAAGQDLAGTGSRREPG